MRTSRFMFFGWLVNLPAQKSDSLCKGAIQTLWDFGFFPRFPTHPLSLRFAPLSDLLRQQGLCLFEFCAALGTEPASGAVYEVCQHPHARAGPLGRDVLRS